MRVFFYHMKYSHAKFIIKNRFFALIDYFEVIISYY